MKKFLSFVSVFVAMMLLGCGSGSSSTSTSYFNGITVYNSTLYVTDYNQKVVNAATLSSTDSTTGLSFSLLAGNSGKIGTVDGTGTGAFFNVLEGITADAGTGTLYVGDLRGVYGSVRQISPAGTVQSIIGTTTAGSNCSGCYTSALPSDSVSAFGYPRGIVASNNKLYVIDSFNQGIVKYDISGSAPTYSPGSYAYFYGINNGSYNTQCATGALSSNYSCAFGLAYDSANGVLFATINHTVQMIYPSSPGLPTTGYFQCSSPNQTSTANGWTSCVVAGTWNLGSPGQGNDSTHMNYPDGIAFSNGGGTNNYVLYVADSNNNAIKQISATNSQVISLLSGSTSGTSGLQDNAASSSTSNSNTLFYHPVALAYVPHGTGCTLTNGCLYVTDQLGQRIRLVDAINGNTWTVY